MITKTSKNESIEKVATIRAAKYMAIITILTVLAFALTAVKDEDYRVLFYLILIVPLYLGFYFVLRKLAINEEIIRRNMLRENEEFYLSADGIIEVEPLGDSEFMNKLREKAKFTAKQCGEIIIVYIESKEIGEKYKKPVEFDRRRPGHLLEAYKFVY